MRALFYPYVDWLHQNVNRAECTSCTSCPRMSSETRPCGSPWGGVVVLVTALSNGGGIWLPTYEWGMYRQDSKQTKAIGSPLWMQQSERWFDRVVKEMTVVWSVHTGTDPQYESRLWARAGGVYIKYFCLVVLIQWGHTVGSNIDCSQIKCWRVQCLLLSLQGGGENVTWSVHNSVSAF